MVRKIVEGEEMEETLTLNCCIVLCQLINFKTNGWIPFLELIELVGLACICVNITAVY